MLDNDMILQMLTEIKQQIAQPPVEKIVFSIQEIGDLFGKGEQWAYKIVRTPDFPTPIYVEGKLNRCWMQDEVKAWAKKQRMLKAV